MNLTLPHQEIAYCNQTKLEVRCSCRPTVCTILSFDNKFRTAFRCFLGKRSTDRSQAEYHPGKGSTGISKCLLCYGRRKPEIHRKNDLARVAELADALDLGSSGATRAGSSPVSRTHRYPSCSSDRNRSQLLSP